MAKKDSCPRFSVIRSDNDTLLIARHHRTQWSFHAIVGEIFTSEDEAKQTLAALVKSKAIPDVKYSIRKS
jgi:hypothetical protein